MCHSIQLSSNSIPRSFGKITLFYYDEVLEVCLTLDYMQGPVAYGDDGTIIYNKIRLTQLRLNEEGKSS